MLAVKKLHPDDEQIELFVKKMNVAFLARCSDKAPVSPLSANDLQENQELFALFDEEEMVAGLAFLFEADGIYIKHVWCDISKQKRGYASRLLDEVILIAKGRDYKELKLGVCSVNVPALNLYKKKGFKYSGVYTHTPNTYCHYAMIKRLKKEGKLRFEINRVGGRVLSSIKHFSLFKRDGTPKLIYKIKYGNNQNNKE